MSAPRLLPTISPFSPAPTSRCFRTDAAGRIALRRDWPALFREITRLPAVAFQTRHAYARLVHYGPLPELEWSSSGAIARDQSSSIHLRCASWGDAWGRIAPCDCCGSPGRIEILNTHGAEFLQLCSAADRTLAEWASSLARLAAPLPRFEPARRPAVGFDLAPDGLRTVAADGELLPILFSALLRENLPVRAMLRTPEATQIRALAPAHAFVDADVLSVGDGRTTLQLALAPVRRLALASDDSLHVAGPGGTLLLSLAAAEGESRRWSAAVHALLET